MENGLFNWSEHSLIIVPHGIIFAFPFVFSKFSYVFDCFLLVLGMVFLLSVLIPNRRCKVKTKRFFNLGIDTEGGMVYKNAIQAEVGTSADGKVGNTL